MKPWLKKSLLVLAAAILLAQFIPIDRSVPETSPETDDFLNIVNAPAEMATLVKVACYDCHSYETAYPWYTNIAPLSFWIQGHINGGRQKLNFSDWSTYTKEKAAHKLEESAEEIEEAHMPLKSYTVLHPESSLTEVQKTGLALWFRQQYKAME